MAQAASGRCELLLTGLVNPEEASSPEGQFCVGSGAVSVGFVEASPGEWAFTSGCGAPLPQTGANVEVNSDGTLRVAGTPQPTGLAAPTEGSGTRSEDETSGADVLMPTTGTGEPFSAAPREISVGNTPVWDIEWEGWGEPEATGRGTTLLETCDPNCAEGKTEEVEVLIRVSDIGECNGVRIYRQLAFDDNEPYGPARPGTGCAY